MTESTENEYRQQRLENMNKLTEMGYDPFGSPFERTGRLSEIRKNYEDEKKVKVAGRLTTIRDMGKSAFADIHDGSDRFQIYVKKDIVGESEYAAFKLLDIGDHISVEGGLFTTRTEEPSIKVEKWSILSKALLPLPEKWHGLKDVESRYRQRYLDLVANPEVRDLFNKRIKIVQEVRSFLCSKGFMEVETPMMHPQAGGAAAKPFVTHYEALNTDMYLRIAPELYLKQLLVGGFDKVFELNRCFRNEGLSRTHNPEFTMLEIYEAYSDVEGMKILIQDLIRTVADNIFGTFEVGTKEMPISLELPWRDVNYSDLIKERMGEDWYDLSLDDARAKLEAEGVYVDPEWDKLLVTHEVYEKLIEKTLIAPTFVRRLPSKLVPLAKRCADDETVVDVFELVIGGQEIAPAYTELNNPIAQRERLSDQAGEDAEKIDEEFLEALEHGMPPAGGMGMGIDRLVMILSGAETIRDVILFPQLKPKA